MTENARKILVGLGFVLFSIILIGIFYLFGGTGTAVNISFSYVAGLSMIVLPCTLPLAFVIVPLSMGKSPKKGLLMALFFGLGLSLTLSLYGLFVALAGNLIGLDQAMTKAGLFSRILFIIGGFAAFVFGLSELSLIRFKPPSYSGAYPEFIQKQKDYLKAFFLGIFLGNAGVGCPNPLFYVLLGYISTVGSLSQGWWLGFVHGVGRATPLIFLSILGMLGINVVSAVAAREKLVKKISGWSLIVLGAFIIVAGTSHQWYEEGPVHQTWNNIVQITTGGKIGEMEMEEKEAEHEETPDLISGPVLPPLVLLTLILGPIFWYTKREKGGDEKQ